MEWIPSNSGRWDQSSTERVQSTLPPPLPPPHWISLSRRTNLPNHVQVRGRAMSSTATEARNLDHPAGQEHLADAV